MLQYYRCQWLNLFDKFLNWFHLRQSSMCLECFRFLFSLKKSVAELLNGSVWRIPVRKENPKRNSKFCLHKLYAEGNHEYFNDFPSFLVPERSFFLFSCLKNRQTQLFFCPKTRRKDLKCSLSSREKFDWVFLLYWAKGWDQVTDKSNGLDLNERNSCPSFWKLLNNFY